MEYKAEDTDFRADVQKQRPFVAVYSVSCGVEVATIPGLTSREYALN